MLEIFLFFIFARPFIASLAFPYLNSIYSVCFLLFLVIVFFQRKVSFERIKSLKYPVILFCLAILISLFFSTNRINSIKELYKYVTGLLLFTIASSLTYKDAERVVKTIIFSGCVICFLAVYQYFIGFQNLLGYLAKIKNPSYLMKTYILSKRVFFPFVTPSTLASYLIMIITLVLPFKNNIWFISLFVITLFFTKSVGAFACILLVLGLYFYLADEINKNKIFLLLGLYFSLIIIFFVRAESKIYSQPIFSTMNRMQYWRDTLAVIKSFPVFGVGLGNFSIPGSYYAHNTYLQIWAEMGILGIIGWLWLIILVLIKGFKLNSLYMKERIMYPSHNAGIGVKPTNFFKGIKILGYPDYMFPGIVSAIVVFLIHNIIDFSFYLPEVSLIWWVLLGLMFAEKKHAGDKDIL